MVYYGPKLLPIMLKRKNSQELRGLIHNEKVNSALTLVKIGGNGS